jgi:hypothetical protein
VHLIPEGNGRELRHRSTEGEPAAHDLAHGLVTPKPEIESPSRLLTSAGNPGNDAIPLSPTWDFEPGDWTGEGNFRY